MILRVSDPQAAVNLPDGPPRLGDPAAGHPITLTVTTGRSGSSFLAQSFQESVGDLAAIHHEHLTVRQAMPARFHRAFDGPRLAAMAAHPPLAAALETFAAQAETGPVVDFGWTMSAAVPLFRQRFGGRLRVIVLYRHPVAAAASMAILGLYSNYPRTQDYMVGPWNEGASDRRLEPRWAAMSEFEKCLWRWDEITRTGFEIAARWPDLPVLFVNSDRVFDDPAALDRIAAFCGIEEAKVSPSAFRNENRRENLETNPIGPEWRRFADFPDIIARGQALGFSFDEATLTKAVSKYALPRGPGAWLRHRSRYWLVRRRVIGTLHRRIGLGRGRQRWRDRQEQT